MGRVFAMLFMGACASGGGDAVDAPPLFTDAPPQVRFDAASLAVPCTSADELGCAATGYFGTVSGDTGNDTMATMGYQSTWLRLRVSENDSGFGGKKMRLAATLTSPAFASFEVHTYVNMSTDTLECATEVGTATVSNNVDEVRLEWGEGGLANGADDGRDVAIEVRPVGGTCATDRTWTLSLAGDWQ